jgi:hypothetical protein
MRSLAPPSRGARGPGLPALQAHNSPNAQRDDPAGLFTRTPATFFRPHRAGGTTRGQSAREPPLLIARALCLSCTAGTIVSIASHLPRVPGAAQRATPMLVCDECSRCAADPGPFHTPPARRSRFCSASQRNQVYADCVNLSALLRCARDTRSPRVTHRAGAGAGRRCSRLRLRRQTLRSRKDPPPTIVIGVPDLPRVVRPALRR